MRATRSWSSVQFCVTLLQVLLKEREAAAVFKPPVVPNRQHVASIVVGLAEWQTDRPTARAGPCQTQHRWLVFNGLVSRVSGSPGLGSAVVISLRSILRTCIILCSEGQLETTCTLRK